jgi:thioredoxin-like negative regulator of GroEL
VYTLIRRGMVLASRDDVAGALASFQAALDREMHLPDVGAAMGEIYFDQGAWEDAERYLRGAIVLGGEEAGVHTLRGLARLAQGEVRAAEESFDRALELDRSDATAKCGLAWCAYLDGDSVEAMTRYRELDDERRELPEDDPWRVYAKRQIERISDHEEQVVWSDGFERQQLMNGWTREEDAGPTVQGPVEGVVKIEGPFSESGRTRLKREYNAGDFVSLEARLKLHGGSRVRVGLFVAAERFSRGEWETRAEISLSRNPDGTVQTRFLRRGGEDLPYEDVVGVTWPTDEWMSLRIERYGESAETRFRLSFDGLPVIEDVRVPTMGSTSGTVWVGAFAEGEPGRSVTLEIDDVQVVERQR